MEVIKQNKTKKGTLMGLEIAGTKKQLLNSDLGEWTRKAWGLRVPLPLQADIQASLKRMWLAQGPEACWWQTNVP